MECIFLPGKAVLLLATSAPCYTHSSSHITEELVRASISLQTYRVRVCILSGSLGDPHGCECSKSSAILPLIFAWLGRLLRSSLTTQLEVSPHSLSRTSFCLNSLSPHLSFLLTAWCLPCFFTLCLFVKVFTNKLKNGKCFPCYLRGSFCCL